MKNSLFFLLLLSLSSCSKLQEPILKNFGKIEVSEIKGGIVTVAAEALYENPNSIGGRLNKVVIDVWANDNKIGQIDQDMDLKIEPNSEFSVPLVITFPISEITKDQSNLLGGLLRAVLNKKVDMEYKGILRVRLAGIPFKLTIDQEEEVLIK